MTGATVALRPILVFDGHCGFCRFWVARWRHRTGDRVEYHPFQAPEIADRLPHIPREQFARAVHLIEPDGFTSSGARAVFRLLALGGPPPYGVPLWIYDHLPGAAALSEYGYRVVADHRPFFARLTTLLWGRVTEPSTYALSAWLFRRVLGVVYLIAFWSMALQVLGLLGHDGVTPASDYMNAARGWARIEQVGLDRVRMFPTIFWAGTSDALLKSVCLGGMALSVLLVAGVAPLVLMPLLWLGYLSLSVVGQEFLSFQWDALLLETGFLAIFIAPTAWRDRRDRVVDPPRLGVGLLLWLLFRLMIGSGASKLTSGDPTWRHFTALSFHYETQPIPTPVAWYAHHLPIWCGQVSAAILFGIELAVPLLFVAPRRARIAACTLLVALQVVIALTGNYAFFNLLSALLCVLLLDDAVMGRALRLSREALAAIRVRSINTPSAGRRYVLIAVALVTLPVSATRLAGSFHVTLPAARLVSPLSDLIQPFRSVNQYGLFAVMTTTRPEIVIEGSNDGETWLEYAFKYKAGDLQRRPPWVAPHQPRLDWQMWFAALSTFEREPWFEDLCGRILEGSPAVMNLLGPDPFHGQPPRYVRAVVYRYRFSDRAARANDGVWWTRERTGDYSPVLSLSAASR